MIKICYVFYNLDIGGVEKLTIDIANLLNKEDFEVSIYCLYSSTKINLRPIIHPDIFLKELSLDNAKWIEKIACLKKELKKFDIIHSCSEDSHVFCSVVNLLSFSKKKKFLMTIHGAESVFIKDRNLQEIIRTWSFKYYFLIRYFLTFGFHFYTSFISVCNYTKLEFAKNRKISKSRIHTIYHGILIEENLAKDSEICNLRTSLGISDSEVLLGYVGRLSNAKGIEDLLYVFNKLSKEMPDLRLILIGDGNLKPYTQDFIVKNGLQAKCYIQGFTLNVKIFYKVMDIFVLPSKSESTSMVTQEAMLNSTLCLCSDVGGIPEIINSGVNGVLFKNSDIEDFETKLRWCILNRDNVNDIKENAKQTILDKFNLSKNVLSISKFLQRL